MLNSRNVISLLTVVLLAGAGLGIWAYGTLPTSDHDKHPLEYALNTENIRTHLTQLLEIAGKHNNSRSVTNGHAASAEYVMARLRAEGDCDVHVQRFRSPVWTERGEPRLRVRAPVDVEYISDTDFSVMRYGGQGARIRAARVVVVADACKTDAVDDVDSAVAVVSIGSACSLFDAAHALERRGAAAVVVVRAARYKTPSRARVRLVDWKEGDPLMRIPVLSTTHSTGEVLRRAAAVDIETDTRIDIVETFNVICVGRSGDASSSVVVGAHLDSVAAGPGINDNASGAATALEIHLTLARTAFRPRSRLVFAWWGAEEDGLLGSRHFARVLAHGWRNHWSVSERLNLRWPDLALNLNLDMLASPNFIAQVHNGSDASAAARSGSQQIQHVFEDYFARHAYPYQLVPMLAGSDFVPFLENGVPAGGVLTGNAKLKTIDERREHGGLAHAALDPCYHRECDGLLNVNMLALNRMARAAMHAVSSLASMPDLRAFLNGNSPFSTL
ncbi:Zn-dependent exopeptidase [Coemansia reversa NRRL 1564]|uniref:Peptide hydrolase n=1 Tax=Coemansia reversa (strain ATCC 12441 / NRRL 1564) TaxID=763665 RepID=A0A2G5B429_COERN|nr:Zn-dependent exopeptidase [Coemansia reversa NRRL 1564]|eukprot:PIA13751.1 Zn-dependent exopeptidase [Coemansia reversa NRRL 1564]